MAVAEREKVTISVIAPVDFVPRLDEQARWDHRSRSGQVVHL
jgi:hypothetical protein